MRGRKPNLNNVAQIPVEYANKPDKWHVDNAARLCPLELNGEQLMVWNRIAPELSKSGRLQPLHVDTVSEYCKIVVRLSTVRAQLAKEGYTFKTTGRHGDQWKANPRVVQMNDDWRKWHLLAGNLGLSPAAERTLVKTVEEANSNGFAKL